MTTIIETPEVITSEDTLADTLTMTLPDLIRLGSMTTEQAIGWGRGEMACALAAAGIAAHQMGLVD